MVVDSGWLRSDGAGPGDAGGLVISGGGSVIVATDELRAQADALRSLVGALSAVHREVTAVSQRHSTSWLVAADAPISAQAAERATASSLDLIQRCSIDAERASWMLQAAMHGYGVVEAVNAQLAQAMAARVGFVVGKFAPFLLLMVAALVGTGASVAVLDGAIDGRSPREVLRELAAWARDHNEVLNDPTTVELVRAAMHSSDDVLGGLLQRSPGLVALLGEEGLGLLGLGTTAALAVMVGRTGGRLAETGVTVSRSTTVPTTAPRTLAGRANRIPSPRPELPDTPQEQVRIDRYRTAGQPDRFEVYVAGTVDVGIDAGAEPWDMTSNVNAIAGLPAASPTAVREAMTQAGVTAASPVVMTGHSQGALAAAVIAASGDYNVTNLVTFGAPTGLVEIPPEISVLNVRHTDDIVPALGGYDSSPHALVVEREFFAGVPVPTDEVFAAHGLDRYRETAALVDDAESQVVRDALSELRGFAGLEGGGTTTVESSTYLARRVH
jgi:hypothetical protein